MSKKEFIWAVCERVATDPKGALDKGGACAQFTARLKDYTVREIFRVFSTYENPAYNFCMFGFNLIPEAEQPDKPCICQMESGELLAHIMDFVVHWTEKLTREEVQEKRHQENMAARLRQEKGPSHRSQDHDLTGFSGEPKYKKKRKVKWGIFS